MNILDELECLEKAATPGPVQLGGQRPGHGDTLVLWPALFSMSGGLIAYMNSDADAALYAAMRNAQAALWRVARAVQQERALGAYLDSEAVANMAPDERAAAYVAWRAADQEIVAALAALEATP